MTTKEGFDPGMMALLVAHIVSSELVPSRILVESSVLVTHAPFSDGTTPRNAI